MKRNLPASDAVKSWIKGRQLSTAFLILLAACALWTVWPALVAMADRWARDPRYAHGYLVPIFSLALLWVRRARLVEGDKNPSTWGLPFFAVGAVAQLAGAYFLVDWLSRFPLLAYLAGIAVLLGGWRAFHWAWPSIAFLAFMIPLPWRLETALGPPLQSMATSASTCLLQTLGVMAFAEGNVIQLSEGQINVVEACSGLSMLITFTALSTAAAIVVKRPLLDRVVLVASSIPVALFANVIRITGTAILHETIGERAATTFYHDLAGWIMIPLALLLYWLEIWAISHMLIEPESRAPLVVARS
jgi:exosortase